MSLINNKVNFTLTNRIRKQIVFSGNLMCGKEFPFICMFILEKQKFKSSVSIIVKEMSISFISLDGKLGKVVDTHATIY